MIDARVAFWAREKEAWVDVEDMSPLNFYSHPTNVVPGHAESLVWTLLLFYMILVLTIS